MKLTRQLTAVTFALIAATATGAAFASSDDGTSDNAWLQQAAAQVSAPAPAAAAGKAQLPRDLKVVDDSNQIVIP